MIDLIKKYHYFIIYSLIELVLGILLITESFNKTDIVKYIFVLLDFILSAIILLNYKSKTSFLLFLAFFFICLADYNLILLGENKTLGVIFFLLCQFSFMLNIGIKKIDLIIRLFILAILEIAGVIVCKDLYSPLVFFTLFYFSTFILNIIFGFIKKYNIIFLIGMILFALCDVCVGLSNFELFKDPGLINIASKLVFYFYLPGLYLIILGSLIKESSTLK